MGVTLPDAGVTLLQKILQSPEPPAGAVVLVLSARDEEPGEQEAREKRAAEIREPQIVLHLDAENTHEEAVSALKWARRDHDFVIVTSAYHQLRAFLTFVKVFEGTGVRLWNASAPSAWDKLEDETLKIAQYQAKHHVASYDEGLMHLLERDGWEQPYVCVA